MADPATTIDTTTPREWLDHLYGTAEEGWLSIFSVNRSGGARPPVGWAEVTELDQLAALITQRNDTDCVWLSCAIRREPLGSGRRGGAEDCTALPGLWLDIDIAGPAHADNEGLALTIEDALRLVASFPLPPTVIINSGHGLQPWWLFEELVDVDTTTPALRASWQATWNKLGAAAGVAVDDVSDIARVMRIPGTINRKKGRDDSLEPVPVQIIDVDWARRYGLDDLEQHLITPAPAEPNKASAIPYVGPARPGDAYNVAHRSSDVLARAGFRLVRTDRDAAEHWQHPWNASSDTSATVYSDGHCALWSSTILTHWTTAQVNHGYDPFGLLVHAEYGGSFADARQALRTQGYGTSTDHVLGLVGGGKPPPTTRPPDAPAPWPDPIDLDHVPPPPAWPAGIFPAWIEDQVTNIAQAIQCAPSMPAVAALGALSVISVGHAAVETRRRHLEHLALYLVTVADVSAGKSPAQGAMFGPVHQFEVECMAQQAPERAKAASRRKIADKAASRAEDVAAATGDPGEIAKAIELRAAAELVDEPSEGRLITTDITPERVASVMSANDERITIVTSEPDVLQVDRYGDRKRGRNLAIFLEAWSGKPVTVDRQSAPVIQLKRPLMTFAVASQPEPWNAILSDPELRNRGFAQRFMADRAPNIGRRDHDLDRNTRDDDADDTYTTTILELARRLRSYSLLLTLHLDPEAKAVWKAWANGIEDRVGLGADLEEEKGWVSKMRDSVIRVAGLLHLADHATAMPLPTEIGADAMVRATAVGDYWIAHRLHSLDAVANQVEPAKLLAALLRLSVHEQAVDGVIPHRLIGRLGPRSIRTTGEVAPAMEILERHHLVRLVGAGQADGMPFQVRYELAAGVQVHPSQVGGVCATCATETTPGEEKPAESHVERSESRMSRMSLYRGFGPPPPSLPEASEEAPSRHARHARQPEPSPPSPDPLDWSAWADQTTTEEPTR